MSLLAAVPSAAGFLACGCGLLVGWLYGWLASWDYQRHVYMSLATGLLVLQNPDRLDGLLARCFFSVLVVVLLIFCC